MPEHPYSHHGLFATGDEASRETGASKSPTVSQCADAQQFALQLLAVERPEGQGKECPAT
jgi:hypothetical protein